MAAEDVDAIITVVVTGTGNYTGSVSESTAAVEKAEGTASVNIAGWTYNETASAPVVESATNGTENVTYSYEGDGINYKSDKAPTDAGDYVLTATFAATATYKEVVKTAEFTIAKAKPLYTVPTDLKATEGQTLADVTLPDGWTWKDDVTTSVGAVGDNVFTAVFTPADTNNYEVAEEDVTITVAKPTAIDETAAVSIYAADGTIYVDAETYTIYNAAGQDVTAENGSLKGMYIVVAEGNTVKIRVN